MNDNTPARHIVITNNIPEAYAKVFAMGVTNDVEFFSWEYYQEIANDPILLKELLETISPHDKIYSELEESFEQLPIEVIKI